MAIVLWCVKNVLMLGGVVCVQESAAEVDQLRRDKEELLNRVVSLQQQQEAASSDNNRLCKKVSVLKMLYYALPGRVNDT